MGKHFFHETVQTSLYSEYHRLIYCEYCGLVAWNFNANKNTVPSLNDLQAQVGNECKANLAKSKAGRE